MEEFTANQMQLVMLPKPELDAINSRLKRMEDILLGKCEDEISRRLAWVGSDEARKQIGVCQKTWQTMRDKHQIPFSQFGRKIYVRQSDIDAFLMSHTR